MPSSCKPKEGALKASHHCNFIASFDYKQIYNTTGVENLWLVSQMWLFWWRHVARLIFS